MKRRTLLNLMASTALIGIGALAPLSAQAQAVDIGFSVPDTTNPFLGWLTGEVKSLAEQDGRRLEIADAGASPVKQMEQIENFIAMGVKVIDIMPVDPNNVRDIISRAQAQGVKILVQGTDTGVYDVMMNIDQHDAGVQAAEMAIAWIEETFGDETAKVIIIPATDTVDAKNRSDGLIDKMKEWGKADLVVSPTEARSTAQGASVMETLLLQNPDTDVVLTYNADTAMGVNEYIMGQGQIDHAKFGVFTGDWSPPVQETIDMSASNESVLRGTIQIVGPVLNGEAVDLPIATYMVMDSLIDGETPYGNWIKDAVAKAGPSGN